MPDSQEIVSPGKSSQTGSNALGGSRKVSRRLEVIRALLGMSRAIVAVFVLAHAGLAAILATGHLPDIQTIAIGSLACIFGTGALIGLNDLLDIDLDRRRIAAEAAEDADFDIGSLFIHHPVAKGIISLKAGIAWVITLSALSVIFIYLLKPSLWPIFFAIAVFVVLYSLLGKITYWKFLTVAMAVTLGALAGWLTVSEPNSSTFLLFGLWTFLWEIGGRNVPNDFNDVDEDTELSVKTIPVVLGPAAASRIVFAALFASYIVSIPLFILAGVSFFFLAAALAAGIYLLLLPASRLLRDPRPEMSLILYNKSAVYPLVLLLLIMVDLFINPIV